MRSKRSKINKITYTIVGFYDRREKGRKKVDRPQARDAKSKDEAENEANNVKEKQKGTECVELRNMKI